MPKEEMIARKSAILLGLFFVVAIVLGVILRFIYIDKPEESLLKPRCFKDIFPILSLFPPPSG